MVLILYSSRVHVCIVNSPSVFQGILINGGVVVLEKNYGLNKVHVPENAIIFKNLC
jgi:hypothetical protein